MLDGSGLIHIKGWDMEDMVTRFGLLFVVFVVQSSLLNMLRQPERKIIKHERHEIYEREKINHERCNRKTIFLPL